MKIDINEDFEKYQDEVYGSFSMRQCVVAICGLLLAAMIAISLWYFLKIDIVMCTYISIPVMIPICAIGFFQYQKQTPIKLIKEILYMKKTEKLFYHAEELPKGAQRVFSMKIKENRNSKEAEK